MHGFFIKYLRVKASRGKKIMVEVDTVVDRYLASGIISDGFLIYKKRHAKKNEDKCRISVPAGSVYKYLGINWINVDEKNNNILKADFTVVDGHDAEQTEDLYIRALNKPSLIDNKTKILIILIIIVMVMLLVIGMLNFQIYKKITALNQV